MPKHDGEGVKNAMRDAFMHLPVLAWAMKSARSTPFFIALKTGKCLF
jgi:hypothetical protein